MVVDVVQNRSLKTSNVLDASIGAISFIPGWGWLVGGTYFGADMITKGITGKSIGDHVDQFVEEKFNADAGSIVNW